MMKKVLAILLCISFISCETPEDSQTNVVDKIGAIEITYSTKTVGSFVVAETHKKVWANGTLFKTEITFDTLPQLPKSKEMGEDAAGNEKEIIVQKEYQYFITIK